MRWRVPLHAAGLALCFTATGLSSSHRRLPAGPTVELLRAARVVAAEAGEDPESLRAAAKEAEPDDGFARDGDGDTTADHERDADQETPAGPILEPIVLSQEPFADEPSAEEEADVSEVAEAAEVPEVADEAESAVESPASPRATILPPLPLAPETVPAPRQIVLERIVPQELTPADIAAQELVAEPVEPVPVAPRAEPKTETFSADGIKLQTAPLTKISKDLIGRAAKRDTKSIDYSADYFKQYPCVAYGITRSPEGIPTLMAPTAGDFCYQPLFFEQKNLERYGRSHGIIQPVLSGARFFATIPALPYLATVNHPWTCYDTHYPYPAGFPAPRVRELPPPSALGGAVQTGAVLGLILLIP